MEIVAEIQARWDARARDAAIQFISSGNREPPFGKNADNYWDFRGIRLDRALRIEGRTLQACDFSEATVNFFFEDCVLTDLRFHKADGRLSIAASAAENLSIRSANLTEVLVLQSSTKALHLEGLVWAGNLRMHDSSCDAMTSNACVFTRASIHDCVFRNSVLNAAFNECQFTRSIFDKGRTDIRGGLLGCDLTSAEFHDCRFQYFEIKDCKLANTATVLRMPSVESAMKTLLRGKFAAQADQLIAYLTVDGTVPRDIPMSLSEVKSIVHDEGLATEMFSALQSLQA